MNTRIHSFFYPELQFRVEGGECMGVRYGWQGIVRFGADPGYGA